MTRNKSPESGKHQRLTRVSNVNFASTIALARKRKRGVWSNFDAAPHHSGEVHTQKGKLCVGHRIDQVSNERLALRPQFVVLAAKRKYLDRALLAGHRRDSI